MKQRLMGGAGIVALTGVGLFMSFHYGRVGDTFRDSGPVLQAAIDGRWHDFFKNDAIMGPFSLMLRLPFVLLASLGDPSETTLVRVGAIPCVMASVVLGICLFRLMRSRGQSIYLSGFAALFCVANPPAVKALQYGHPEEILGASLIVGALLAAMSRRWLLAAILFALGLTTKQWALVAIAPMALAVVLFKLPRLRFVAIVAALATLVMLPSLVASAGGTFSSQKKLASSAGEKWHPASPYNVWYPFQPVKVYKIAPVGGRSELPVRYVGPVSAAISRPAIVLLPLLLLIPLLIRRNELDITDPLLFLAFVFLLRCVLDPLNNAYYHVPLLFALIAWESLTVRGIQILSIVVASVWLMYSHLPFEHWGDYPLFTPLYLAWAIPLVLWMAVRLFAPGIVARTRRYGSRIGLEPRARLSI